jgi:hypothetical protein
MQDVGHHRYQAPGYYMSCVDGNHLTFTGEKKYFYFSSMGSKTHLVCIKLSYIYRTKTPCNQLERPSSGGLQIVWSSIGSLQIHTKKV